jgi:hypothetical protein
MPGYKGGKVAKKQSKRNAPKRATSGVKIPKFKAPAPPPGPANFAASYTGFANGNQFILGIQVNAQGNLAGSSIAFGSNPEISIQGTFNQTTNEIDFVFGTSVAGGFDVFNYQGYLLGVGALAGIFGETLITFGPPVQIQNEEFGWWAFPNPF